MIFNSSTRYTRLPKTCGFICNLATKSLALLVSLGIYANLFSQNVFPSTGNVGIGTPTPSYPLNVVTPIADVAQFKASNANNTRIVVANNIGQVNLGIGSTLPYSYIWSNTGKFFVGGDGIDPTLFVDGMNNGNVGIGTTDTKGYRFAVNGDAIFTKVKVKTYTNWPDYVFEKNYILPTLQEVENFILVNKHLPGVVSGKEIEINGLDLGDNQATLLQKIEELTLYIIAQDKEIEALKSEIKEINELRNEIAAIKTLLNKLK